MLDSTLILLAATLFVGSQAALFYALRARSNGFAYAALSIELGALCWLVANLVWFRQGRGGFEDVVLELALIAIIAFGGCLPAGFVLLDYFREEEAQRWRTGRGPAFFSLLMGLGVGALAAFSSLSLSFLLQVEAGQEEPDVHPREAGSLDPPSARLLVIEADDYHIEMSAQRYFPYLEGDQESSPLYVRRDAEEVSVYLTVSRVEPASTAGGVLEDHLRLRREGGQSVIAGRPDDLEWAGLSGSRVSLDVWYEDDSRSVCRVWTAVRGDRGYLILAEGPASSHLEVGEALDDLLAGLTLPER